MTTYPSWGTEVQEIPGHALVIFSVFLSFTKDMKTFQWYSCVLTEESRKWDTELSLKSSQARPPLFPDQHGERKALDRAEPATPGKEANGWSTNTAAGLHTQGIRGRERQSGRKVKNTTSSGRSLRNYTGVGAGMMTVTGGGGQWRSLACLMLKWFFFF